ncbi:MAG: 30S ribosomal protein S2 [Ilumatobacteraceae bacterium]
MRQMLEAGAHFGHQTRRWNPKMKRFIFGERNGIYIIDLEQTLGRVDSAYGYVRDLVARGGTLLFVGTKKQAQDPIRSYAEKCNMPFVNERWLGGMLTNFDTISKRIGKMLEYERMKSAGDFEQMPKKEALMLSRELEKLQRNLGGLRGMKARPDAIFVLDTKKEHIAVTEANKLGIPVVAVVDTNVDPELVNFPMPGNDDAIRANTLFARVIAEAVIEGRYVANRRAPAAAEPAPRSAEDEAAFEAAQANARRQAAQAAADRDARFAASKVAADQDSAPANAPAEPVEASTVSGPEAAEADTTPDEVPAETTPTDVPATSTASDECTTAGAEGSASDEADATSSTASATPDASDEADAREEKAKRPTSPPPARPADDVNDASAEGSASDEAEAAQSEKAKRPTSPPSARPATRQTRRKVTSRAVKLRPVKM